MTNPIAQLSTISYWPTPDRTELVKYQALAFWCPGCQELMGNGHSGLHMLPVHTSAGRSPKTPAWEFDGNLDAPTLSPSVLTRYDAGKVCHSYVKKGVIEFLGDCTHSLAGQHVPLPPLPDWFVRED